MAKLDALLEDSRRAALIDDVVALVERHAHQRKGLRGVTLRAGLAWVHGVFIVVTLAIALVLTVYSMIDYLWSYRSLVGVRS